jgi:hypothetical protein
MISSEVQRTLVKSPPELWAELSDPAALARHLGELGEIRITRTEPEKTVEWEAENTTGTVSIQASGWGTKVTLSVTRESVGTPPEAESLPELEAVAKPEVTAEPDASAEPEAVTVAVPQAVPEPTAAAEPELAPQPRRGFFARLFGRRRQADTVGLEPHEEVATTSPLVHAEETTTAEQPLDTPVEEAVVEQASQSPDAFAAVSQALAQESFAAIDPFAIQPTAQPTPDATELEHEHEAEPEQIGDISAELLAAEEVAEEEVTAVLTAVLDRLGAAHHRPFSRS